MRISAFTLNLQKKYGVIIYIYVDDLLFTSDDKAMLTEFKNSMLKAFDMTDLGSNKILPWYTSNVKGW